MSATEPTVFNTSQTQLTQPFPSLRSWLEGASEFHPWVECLNEKVPPTSILSPLESICSTLDTSTPPPNRLNRKRRDFKNDIVEENVLNLRIELLVAANLIWNGISFEFGGEGEPDFKIENPDMPLYLEITARIKDDLKLLVKEVQCALENLPIRIEIETEERLLEIKASCRLDITNRTITLARELHTDPVRSVIKVPINEISGSITFRKIINGDDNVVQVSHGPLLTNLMNEIESQIPKVADIKAKQANRGSWSENTILVIDLSRLSWSWMRSRDVWLGALAQLSLRWETLPFLGIAVMQSGLTTTNIEGAFLPRPDLGDEFSQINKAMMNKIGIISLP